MLELFSIFLALVLASLAIYQDLFYRRVSNYISLLFLLLSSIVYLINFEIGFYILLIDFSILLFAFFISYLLFKFNIWGAADGKILLILILFLLGVGENVDIFYFLVNIFFIYTIFIITAVFFFTSINKKFEVIKETDWLYHLTSLLLVFSTLKILIFLFIDEINLVSYFSIIGATIGVMIFLSNYIKEIFYSTLQRRIYFMILVILLFFTAIFTGGMIILYFLPVIILLRILLILVSELSSFIGDDKGGFNSPFIVFIFLSFFLIIIYDFNFIDLIIDLLF